MDPIDKILFLPAIEGGGRGVVEYLKYADEFLDKLEQVQKCEAFIIWIYNGHRLYGTRKKQDERKQRTSRTRYLTT